MDLTVSDLALAVSKSEEYVRRRIHQNDQSARREGRRLFVAQREAARWARESGLSFVLRIPNPQLIGGPQGRTARMTVLAWHPKGKEPVNLFTHVRHRRRDSLGPWGEIQTSLGPAKSFQSMPEMNPASSACIV